VRTPVSGRSPDWGDGGRIKGGAAACPFQLWESAVKQEYWNEWRDDQPPPDEEETLPLWARKEGRHPAEGSARSLESPDAEEAAELSIEDDDLDWIQLDNGWQLVIWDEEEWAEMGLTPAGLSRIIDRLQAVTAGLPAGDVTLSQRELEAALTNQAVRRPQDPSPHSPKISPPSMRNRQSPS